MKFKGRRPSRDAFAVLGELHREQVNEARQYYNCSDRGSGDLAVAVDSIICISGRLTSATPFGDVQHPTVHPGRVVTHYTTTIHLGPVVTIQRKKINQDGPIEGLRQVS